MSKENCNNIVERFIKEIDYVIFGIGIAVTGLTVAGFIFRGEAASSVMWQINDFLWSALGWAYLLIMFISVVFILFLIFGPWGKIKLGKEDDEPEFSFFSYFAMLYSGGTAAGIVFWGPAEAIFHYETPSPLIGAEGMSQEAAVGAVQYSYFHWGISAWSAYVAIAIPIAYFAYRYDAPLRISTVIAPWIGFDNLDSRWAKVIDIIAVFATMGGVATTLGLVGSQFLMGLDYVAGISIGDVGTLLMITGLTVAFTISTAVGIEKGIQRVSYFNMGLFVILTVSVFILGPTAYILSIGTEALGRYLNQFVTMSLYTDAGSAESTGFVGNWTVFFWAWWFSWAPFVGLFIARISRGRTVRQVAFTGVFASTAASIPWYATMGSSAIYIEDNNQANILGVIREYGGNEAVAGYPLFEALPFGVLLMVMFLVLITSFFITSADSSTLALAMLTTGGSESPSAINRIIWGSLIGLLASVLMIVGGVDALQAAAIITGGPFGIILLVAVFAMITMFNKHHTIFLQAEKDEEAPMAAKELSQDD